MDTSGYGSTSSPRRRLRIWEHAAYRDAPYQRDRCHYRQDLLCKNCKQPGHFARECPNMVVCNNCRLPGHIDAECTSNTLDPDDISCFKPTVFLHDWWLIETKEDFQGKRLAVAGLSKQQAVRVFTSAPIIKRYDVFTLETADGICVVVKGFINKSRAIENGFSSEVVNDFLFGFPLHWEQCIEKCFRGESTTDRDKESNGKVKKERKNKEVASRKKTKRKIIYDTPVSPTREENDHKKSPIAGEEKEKPPVVSADSLSCKKSRSGRLLVPTLEFWRNQIAIYDMDGKITGIQGGLQVDVPARGSKSATRKYQR